VIKEIPLIRSFGRIKSRKLSNNKQDLYDNLLPKYELTKEDSSFIKDKKLFLEIGFGFGDFTFEFVKNNPDVNLIAGETHINGIINLLAKLDREPMNNVKIVKTDIRFLLEEIEDNIFDQIYILFPDPWPKVKHHKRRLINKVFINLLSKKIKSGGKLIIATDHDSYKEWIMSVMNDDNNFVWNTKSQDDWQIFPKDWIITKYQKKAKREGRESIYLEFQNS
jgi:tRNA (guanine-N7-)-methyltransferase